MDKLTLVEKRTALVAQLQQVQDAVVQSQQRASRLEGAILLLNDLVREHDVGLEAAAAIEQALAPLRPE